jgi:conjugal transfer pilus assembly protein TraA
MSRTQLYGIAALAAVLVVVGLSSAWAGGDTTFQGLEQLATNWLQGSLGRLIALIGVLVGIGSAVAGSFIGMLSGLAVAAGAYYLPTVITTIAAATL